MKKLIMSLIVGLTLSPGGAFGAVGKVLVVFSSEAKISVVADKARGKIVTHPTGFFLSELMVPLRQLIAAGYEPVFASPRGSVPVMDKVSDSAFWFHGDEKAYRSLRAQCESLGVCGPGLRGTRATLRLDEVNAAGLEGYAAVFLPGGHAPMEDLWKDADLHETLIHFHETGKPTALICHAPIALLSALEDPTRYVAALARGDQKAIAESVKTWIYRGYRMTAFSTKEEQQEEPGQDNVLGGFVRFYPDEALDFAGGKVVVRAAKWNENVVVDRELITGQNPFSDGAFASALLQALR